MPSDEVFRFVNARPVQLAPPERITRGFAAYDPQAKSPFHRELETVQGDREKSIELARRLFTTPETLDADVQLVIDAANSAADQKDVSEAKKAAQRKLGQPLVDFLKSDRAQKVKDYIWDRLYAHTLIPEEKTGKRDLIFAGARALHSLDLLTKKADSEKPLNRAALAAISPMIPKNLISGGPAADNTWEKDYSAALVKELDAVYDRVTSINTAIKELKNSDRKFKAGEQRAVASVGVDAKPEITPLPITTIPRPAIEAPVQKIGGPILAPPPPGSAAEQPPAELSTERTLIVVPKKEPWVFAEFGGKNLSGATANFLANRKEQLIELEVPETIDTLEFEKYEAVNTFVKNLPGGALPFVRNNARFKTLLADVAVPGFAVAPIKPTVPAPGSGSAAARGIQPLGIGDLLVVRQELLRYTTGEVAHIENVMESEFKTRTDVRSREVEEVVVTETERLEETERDLQTTERFELQKESQKTIEEQMSLQAGVSVTASYGPVSVTAHADFALSQSSSESNRTASTFAKEVTERSVSRITQRSREQRMRRTLERFEEKNEHGFDNKKGDDHIIGIYRWVDKYYKARLINYGRRLMLEFIVPEPAAFYLHLQSNQTLKGVTLKKPVEPTVSGRPLRPSDLNKFNYQFYVGEYNVQDVDPYPAETTRVSAAFAEAGGGTENTSFAKTSEKLTVPGGYKCFDVFGEMGYQGIKNTPYFIECLIAGQRWGSVTASGIEGIIPISVKGWLTAFHVNVVAICELKPEARVAWQVKTYAAIMNAYDRALADYNEQVSSAQIQAGVEIEGRNPLFNRRIEQEELKKGVLRLLTNNFARTRVSGAWRFNEMFNSMQTNGQFGYPEFDIPEAIVEGRIIQFFEQAFEWNNVTYRFYPYQWGRKVGWKDIFPLSDTDPMFTDFLRAGAARVIVPAHPAYTETVLHYLATNEIWNGGEPPTLNDPLYISIVDELKADAGGNIDRDLPVCAADSPYPCLADEWEVKLPTTLVYLQKDAALPDMTKK